LARLFVAVQPPREVLDLVAALDRPRIDGLRWTSRSQWHVTLRFLGWVDDVDVARRALEAVDSAPAETVMGPAVGRFGQRVLHVPVQGLDGLAAEVVRATGAIGRPPEQRPWAGHLTLARVAKDRRVDLSGLAGQPVFARWRVNEVLLMESHLARQGATYETVTTRCLGA
jgi:2'-5' RNA ligase